MPKLVRQDGGRPLDIMDIDNIRAVLTASLHGQGTHPLTDIPAPHPAVVTHAYFATEYVIRHFRWGGGGGGGLLSLFLAGPFHRTT